MLYTIEKISNGVATVRYPDNSWAEIVLTENMTEEQLDAMAWNFRPKVGIAPSFVTTGSSRTASPESIITVTDPEWLSNRKMEYGTLESQIEYITENGLDAWQAEVAAIKARYPKPE